MKNILNNTILILYTLLGVYLSIDELYNDGKTQFIISVIYIIIFYLLFKYVLKSPRKK
jgi:hypothetical protein